MAMTINDAIYKTKGKNDECYTPSNVVKTIMPYIPKGWVVWCPFDKEDSEFVKVLSSNGYKVLYSHIDYGQDFYTYEPEEHYDCIVSNPPFTGKREIFERAMQLEKPFMLLMTAQWFNDAAPVQLFLKYNIPMQVIHFDKRIHFKGQENKIPFKSVFIGSGFPFEHDNLLLKL